MKRRSPFQALASSPTMVGAITTLIVVVAVFLAYNANNGLPFVPTYRVNVDVPNAARLVENNEVRIGGNRVGVVESITAVRRPADQREGTISDTENAIDPDTSVDPAGDVVARLGLKLDQDVAPLPQNSIFRIRYKSAFGLKYLDITRGDGPGVPQGYTFDGTDDNDSPNDDDDQILSIDEVSENNGADNGTFIDQTEFDDIGNTFDQRTRNAGRQNLIGYGNAFAGRGGSLNLAIESLNPLFTNLKPVAQALTANETQLDKFFPALGRVATIVAPVAEQQAQLFTNMAITFGAISADPEALAETIAEAPPTLQTGIDVLPAQQTFLAEFAKLSDELRPGVRQLQLALPDLNHAVTIGTPVLKKTPRMNKDLRKVFVQLDQLVSQPTTMTTLKRLKETFGKASKLAKFVAPAQTVCNYFNYWTTMLPEHLTEKDSTGFTQRVSLISTPPGPQPVSLGGIEATVPGEVQTGLSTSGYSGLQANGKAGPVPNPLNDGVFDPTLPILHGNPAGPTGQNGSDCQAGQAGYLLGDLRLPGQPASNPAVGVPDIPGDRGITDVFFKQNGERELVDTRVAEAALMRKSERKRIPNAMLGLIFAIVLAIASYFAFTKDFPWSGGTEYKAVFASAQNLRVNSPVRIAGVEAGKVIAVEPLSPDQAEATFAGDEVAAGGAAGAEDLSQGGAVVTMSLEDDALPLKTDATFKLRPRLFLEGNLFVEVRPGSPGAPAMDPSDPFPPTQTSNSVQLDQVLTNTFQADTRRDLQIFLDEFGTALIDEGGAKSLQELARSSPGSFKYTAQVNEAVLGENPHDLSGLIKHLDEVVAALGQNDTALQDLIVNLRVVSGSFAAESSDLEQAVRELPLVLEAAKPAFANLNASFPAVRAFAREILPGVRSTPATLDAATPLLRQVRLLARPSELRGLAADLVPAVPQLAKLSKRTPDFLEQARSLSNCFNNVIIPWSENSVSGPPDYPHPAVGPVYKETAYGLTGIAGESRSQDANGQYIRVSAGGGTNTVETVASNGQTFAGLVPFPLLGAAPAPDASAKTPFRPGAPCENQDPPNLATNLAPAPTSAPASTAGGANASGTAGEIVDRSNEILSQLGDYGTALQEDKNSDESQDLEKGVLKSFKQFYKDYGSR